MFFITSAYTGKLSARFRTQTLIRTDERVQLMDEIISGVQVIKMYVWEKAFCTLIAFIRKMELKTIRKKYWVHAAFMTCFLFTPRMGLYTTLITQMLIGKFLSTEKVFIFFSYFVILAEVMGATFVRGITEIAETLVAIRRLREFLLYEEFNIQEKCLNEKIEFNGITTEKYSKLSNSEATLTDSNKLEPVNNIILEMTNLTVTFKPESSSTILENISLQIESGKLNIIIGPVGSGKSSLISAILGEIPLNTGKISIKGTISYASQESWIFGSTVRQNILFGQPYDQVRYQEVISACALLRDFSQFPEGDQTIVGDQGSSLSGGQKARINMARAIYRNADIYILDDPLSAVDTHVSNHLFTQCLETYLKNKTVILVTHQLQYVKSADSIVLIENKKLTQYPSFSDFLDNCPAYYKSLTSKSIDLEDPTTDKIRKQSEGNIQEKLNDSEIVDEKNPNLEDNLEDSSGGIVKGSIIAHYFKSGGNWGFIITVGILCILSQCTLTVNDLFFPAMLTEEEKRYSSFIKEHANISTEDFMDLPFEPAYTYIYIYTIIVISIFVIGITQSMLFYTLCMNASQSLHDKAFASVIKTGMNFFDKNPSGRILNRFSKDINAIDELLPKTLHDAELILLIAFGGFVIVCIVNPFFLIPLAVLASGTFWLMRIYARSATSVKRLEGVLKSPVFTYLNTTLNGLITIRAYRAQETLKHEFDKIQDRHSSAWYMFIVTNAAFGFFLDTFCCTFITIVTFSLLIINGYSRADVGLAVTVIISMTAWIR